MFEGIVRAAEARGTPLASCTAAVVGAAGNIGSVLATLLAGQVAALRLVGRNTPDSLGRLEAVRRACLDHEPEAGDRITVHGSLDAIHGADVVTVATSSAEGRLIGPEIIKPGAIVSCASMPSNLSTAFRDRLDDYFVFDGGLASLPDGQAVDCVGLPSGGLAFGCFSETLLLGFAGCDRSFARGPITAEQVHWTLERAAEHGFALGEFKLDGHPHPLGAQP
jgi:predicted amino acid dehydrogenase